MTRVAAGIGLLLLALAGIEAWATPTPPAAIALTALLGFSALGISIAAVRSHRRTARRAGELKAAAHAARERAAALSSSLDALKGRAAILHHGIPEPDVLAGLLPLRLAAAAARARQNAVIAREGRFKASAPAYVAALDAAPPDPSVARAIRVDGLTWWVPAANRDDAAGADRNAAHQDFPYRAIAQTREVAIGGIMLDLGANVGRMSVPRVILGDVQWSYCAEPDPANYACLVRNVVDNQLAGLVLPDRLAIGAENGVVRLHRARSAGGHRVLDAGAPARGDVIEVPCLTLDTWVQRLGIDLQQVSFIKMDVQGSEMGVLQGARAVLACRHVAWQIEIDPATLAHRGQAVRALYDELARHFTHAIDLNRHTGGPRLRPVGELPQALAYLDQPAAGRTDVLLFCLQPEN